MPQHLFLHTATKPKPKEDPLSPSDEDLMKAFKDGNEAAFVSIIDRYQDRLFRYAHRILKNVDRAEEIVQDVFIRILKNAHRYQQQSRFAAYIYLITRNLALNEQRDLSRRKTYPREHLPEFDNAPHMQPQAAAQSSELQQKIEDALNTMPDGHRDAVSLIDIDGLSYKDAAHVLNVSIGSFQSRLSRGRHFIRQYISSHYDIKLELFL